ncbi:hypothetical protein RG47T_2267 [Mucilaginibacter polytrichastri]|uniref:Uncharacterized protein n=1 Tax=Mucilaginibacter polytrichastri TaxID=1302689 RepID=A0A1Q5ZYG7_9SPHI|nr:hypothetical protein RG47T_2267 [Mucilaginibacter polytrichastri]
MHANTQITINQVIFENLKMYLTSFINIKLTSLLINHT